MRNVGILLIGSLLLSSAATTAHASATTDANGTVVIIFKDGHRQNIPASSIEQIQFKTAAGVATPIVIPSVAVPGRGHFVGKWSVGDGNGSTFYITLDENGEATKTSGVSHGTWVYLNGEAQVTWDDGWHDVIRKAGAKHEKLAFEPGRPVTDKPSNVTEAHNTTPRPI